MIINYFWCILLRVFMPKSHNWLCLAHDWSET